MFSLVKFRLVQKFVRSQSGDFAVQSALMFAALAIVGALLAAPILDKVSRQYAVNQPYGIDPVTTASTQRKNSNGNRYVIRRSVLKDGEEVICRSPTGRSC